MKLKQSRMKQKKKGEFLDMLLVTLGASLLGNMLAGKGAKGCQGNIPGRGTIRTSRRGMRVG